MNNQKRTMQCVILSGLAVVSLPCILNEAQGLMGFTNSVLGMLLWIALYAFLQKLHTYLYKNKEQIQEHQKRRTIFSLSIGYLLAILLVAGKGLDTNAELPVKSLWAWWGIAFYGLFFAYLLYGLFSALDLTDHSIGIEEQAEPQRNRLLLVWFLLMLCWLPVLLAVYPGFFVYDAIDEYVQVATRSFTTHHPLIHVLLLGGTICGVHKFTGSYNLGIFIYMLLQMMALSLVFTLLLRFLEKQRVKKSLRILCFFYFACYPVIVMFTLCSAKDTLFAGCMLLMLLLMWEMIQKGPQFYQDKKKVTLLIVITTLMMMLRNNALYGVIGAVPFIIILLKKIKKNYKPFLVILLLAVAMCVGANHLLATLFHAKSEEHQEMLTVPIQQIARIYNTEASIYTEEELEILHEILPEEALRRYTPNLADPVKCDFQNKAYEDHKQDFWRIWAKGFMHSPIGYLNGWLMTSYGYWYPDMIVNVYEGHTVFTFTYEDNSFFGFETEEPGTRDSKLPMLEEFYRQLSLETTAQRIPAAAMLFSMGFVCWIYLLGMGFFWYRKAYEKMALLMVPMMTFLTLLLGPTFVPRYVAFLWFSLPLLGYLILQEINKTDANLCIDKQE